MFRSPLPAEFSVRRVFYRQGLRGLLLREGLAKLCGLGRSRGGQVHVVVASFTLNAIKLHRRNDTRHYSVSVLWATFKLWLIVWGH